MEKCARGWKRKSFFIYEDGQTRAAKVHVVAEGGRAQTNLVDDVLSGAGAGFRTHSGVIITETILWKIIAKECHSSRQSLTKRKEKKKLKKDYIAHFQL